MAVPKNPGHQREWVSRGGTPAPRVPSPSPSASQNALVFMAKWPQPGRAKTRLCPPLTPAQAASLACAFLLDTLAMAACADADLFLAFAPESAASDFRALVGPDVGLIPAEAPHLGIALREGQRAALAMGYRRVALVGSDLPHLPAYRYAEAFAALAGADAVLGPSGDGGYYLLATERETPELFAHITWSTATVYRQTRDRAAAAGLRVAEIAPCDDVDTADDLPRLFDALRRRPGAGHTLRLLERLFALSLSMGGESFTIGLNQHRVAPLAREERETARKASTERARP